MSAGSNVRQWLMTGVSYMIPFVAAGGILIALGFLLGGLYTLGATGDFSQGQINHDQPDSLSAARASALAEYGVLTPLMSR